MLLEMMLPLTWMVIQLNMKKAIVVQDELKDIDHVNHKIRESVKHASGSQLVFSLCH